MAIGGEIFKRGELPSLEHPTTLTVHANSMETVKVLGARP